MVSSRLNKNKIGFNWTGGVKIERGKQFWVKTVIRQDLRDYQDLFFLHHFRLPAIASSSEAGGDENDETRSTKGGINHVNPVGPVK